MIRIQITPTSLSATGHAGYNPGNDIVCFYEGREMEYDKTLKGTFGCSKTHTYAVGRSKRRIHYDVTSLLFDISELKDKQDFTELLKYINTKE